MGSKEYVDSGLAFTELPVRISLLVLGLYLVPSSEEPLNVSLPLEGSVLPAIKSFFGSVTSVCKAP